MKKFKKLLLAVALTIFVISSWLWMSGKLALPEESYFSPMLRAWADPGFLAFPVIVAAVAAILAICLVCSALLEKSND